VREEGSQEVIENVDLRGHAAKRMKQFDRPLRVTLATREDREEQRTEVKLLIAISSLELRNKTGQFGEGGGPRKQRQSHAT
jgi:hypothetical protein